MKWYLVLYLVNILCFQVIKMCWILLKNILYHPKQKAIIPAGEQNKVLTALQAKCPLPCLGVYYLSIFPTYDSIAYYWIRKILFKARKFLMYKICMYAAFHIYYKYVTWSFHIPIEYISLMNLNMFASCKQAPCSEKIWTE